jgi:hypothetical protein
MGLVRRRGHRQQQAARHHRHGEPQHRRCLQPQQARQEGPERERGAQRRLVQAHDAAAHLRRRFLGEQRLGRIPHGRRPRAATTEDRAHTAMPSDSA